MNARQQKRLLNVAKSLREGVPDNFTMGAWGHFGDPESKCGTPACALGHYASRRDLQKVCQLTVSGDVEATDGSDRDPFELAEEHFGITGDEAVELFDATGCGGASTNIQAAKYIEKFVERKVKNQARVEVLRAQEKELAKALEDLADVQNKLDDVQSELYELTGE